MDKIGLEQFFGTRKRQEQNLGDARELAFVSSFCALLHERLSTFADAFFEQFLPQRQFDQGYSSFYYYKRHYASSYPDYIVLAHGKYGSDFLTSAHCTSEVFCMFELDREGQLNKKDRNLTTHIGVGFIQNAPHLAEMRLTETILTFPLEEMGARFLATVRGDITKPHGYTHGFLLNKIEFDTLIGAMFNRYRQKDYKFKKNAGVGLQCYDL